MRQNHRAPDWLEYKLSTVVVQTLLKLTNFRMFTAKLGFLKIYRS